MVMPIPETPGTPQARPCCFPYRGQYVSGPFPWLPQSYSRRIPRFDGKTVFERFRPLATLGLWL
jgi:hypothetical protein